MVEETNMSTPLKPQMKIEQTEIHGKFPDTARYRKLQEWQRIFGRQDGKLVWQKLPRDRVLYRFTVGFAFVSGLFFLSEVYTMIYNPKKK